MTSWILLEHEDELQDMMLAMVEILGDEGVAFSSRSEALEWIEAYEQGQVAFHKPEVALLDIGHDLHDGSLVVANRLHNSSRLNDIIIVLMTPEHLRFEEQERIVVEVGANFVLYKPLPSIDELSLILQGLLLSRY